MIAIPANFVISRAERIPSSPGKSGKRLSIQGLTDPNLHYRFALMSSKIYSPNDLVLDEKGRESKHGKNLRSLGLRRWVVINVLVDGQEGFAKVNAESLRKRLGISTKDFKERLKQSVDFSDEVAKLLKPKAQEKPESQEKPETDNKKAEEEPAAKTEEAPAEQPKEFVKPEIADFIRHPEKYPELAEQKYNHSGIWNTGLTFILACITFDHASDKDLDILIHELVREAFQKSNNDARLALTQVNKEHHSIKNTPLQLLIKAGKSALALNVVHVYGKEDLLSTTTPLGHTALHLAVITGQMDVAFAIMRRAQELDCLKELLALQNKKGKNKAGKTGLTADDLFKAFFVRPFELDTLKFVSPLLGGDEINKAITGENPVRLPMFRSLNDLNLSKKVFENKSLEELLELLP